MGITMDMSRDKVYENYQCQDADANELQGTNQPKTSSKIGNGQEKGTNQGAWKLRKTGMFYKMVLKSLEEKEKQKEKVFAASAPPNYRCWLCARKCSLDNVDAPKVGTKHGLDMSNLEGVTMDMSRDKECENYH